MANGDITVTVSVSGTLTTGDAVRDFSEAKSYSSIGDVFDRVLNVPTSEVTALAIGTVGGQTLAAWNCLIVKNLDATNYVTIGLKDTGAKSAYHRINAGEMYMLQRDQLECDDDSGGSFSSFNSIDTVTLQANTAACRCMVLAF